MCKDILFYCLYAASCKDGNKNRQRISERRVNYTFNGGRQDLFSVLQLHPNPVEDVGGGAAWRTGGVEAAGRGSWSLV